jgi:tetratricopeptide (TPR) repeat protein
MRELALGAGHPDTATSLNNLARLLRAQGDLAAARPLFERALAINEKALGAGHPETATSLNNLASLLGAQGDLAAARPLFERALGIYEQALGTGHPYAGIVLRNLAGVRRQQGEMQAAQPLFARALAIAVAAFGAADARAGYVRNELALTLLMLRRAPEADALLAETWRTLAQPTAIVTPAIAFLALLSAGLQDRAPADPLGRLKTLLLGPALPRAAGIPHAWNVGPLLPNLAPALPSSWHACLAALLAAINDPAQAAALDAFPLWRHAPPVPAETPWPISAGYTPTDAASTQISVSSVTQSE